jgi:hypothetical protein
MIIKDNILIIEVPTDSVEYEIDDFLSNTLKYRIGDIWSYDTFNKLPSNNLKILEILKPYQYLDIDIDRNKKWLLINQL